MGHSFPRWTKYTHINENLCFYVEECCSRRYKNAEKPPLRLKYTIDVCVAAAASCAESCLERIRRSPSEEKSPNFHKLVY